MQYNIHLDNFDGPMDLLLHLVKETKLDIYEIEMTKIIESYLNTIRNLQDLNIDVGSDFLLMASSLLHLKSKMLIGKTTENDEVQDEYDITSEEDLKNRIIEYERIKNVTEDLRGLEEKRKEIYTKLPESLKDYVSEEELFNETGLSSTDLFNALASVLQRLHYKEPVETKITNKEVSVKERGDYIRNILRKQKRVNFASLFEYKTKKYIIATFLAILEMCKNHELILEQKSLNDDIYVEERIWIY